MPPRLSALVLLAASLWVLLNLRWCLFVIVRHVTPLRTELEQLLDEAHVDEAFVDARGGSSYSRPPGAGHARHNAAQPAGGSAQPTAKSRVQPAQPSEPSQAAASGVAPHSAREPDNWQPTNLLGVSSASGGDGGRSGGGGGKEETRAPSVGGGGDGGGGGGGSEPNPDDAAAALLASKCTRGDVRACNNRVEVPINADFNLLAELTREGFAISPARRIELMMSRYQTRPIFGIVENKLLAHSLLHSLGVPQLPVEYGAFARHQLGERQHGQRTPLAVPQLGSCASSGRAWQLWLARRSQGAPTGRPATASGARASRLQSCRFQRLWWSTPNPTPTPTPEQEWATLDEAKMVDALQRVHAMPRGAVIKAATDGGSANILLLAGFGKLPNGSLQFKVDRHDGARWRRFRWATEAVLSQAPLAYADPNPNPTLNPYPDPNPNLNPATTLT